MKANAIPLVALFEKKMRLEVPLFQRQYVWNSDQQWEPLWEDIQRKFIEYLEGRTDSPVHFLGAIVLDQKQTPATHVERRMVIDGQQRLTTLQIFLVAFRDYCNAVGALALAEECQNFTLNKGMMPDPEVDKFKVWPTQLDRKPFKDVVGAGSPDNIKNLYPLTYKKYARKADPRPRIVECYIFFYEQVELFFSGSILDEAIFPETPVDIRLETCFQALRNALLVVAIDLEHGDDAQVIFETLNARGQPLLPADLLRNYIFLRAGRQNESQEALYIKYWAPFDEQFWREAVSQGRINRPRSDLLMQHFLASQQARDIPITHLYMEYRHWIEKDRPFSTVEAELSTLAIARENFGRLLRADSGHPYSALATLLNVFDIGTAYPLMLFLLDQDVDSEIFSEICKILESYLIRRAVCGMSNKNYNRVFLNLTKNLRRDGITTQAVIQYLSDLKGDSAEWPGDDLFYAAWESKEIYNQLNNPRLTYILKRIDALYRGTKVEDIDIKGPLTVEHIMPQSWIENWALTSGDPGMPDHELFDAAPDSKIAVATRSRNSVIHTIGNLTIMTQALNSAVSNSAWSAKKPELLKYSLLPINQELHDVPLWDEDSILTRSKHLFSKALHLWPRQTSA